MGDQTWRSAAAAGEDCATIYVAIELSKSSWLVAHRGPLDVNASRQRLAGGDAKGLLGLIRRAGRAVERETGCRARVLCCYEAGYDGFWLCRFLAARGILAHVLDPASLAVERRARRAKSDRIDVAKLLRALIAYDGGDRQACRLVRPPSVEQEDAKRLHRARQRLVKERTAHVNRIKGLLAGQGIYDFQPRVGDARERLGALVTGDGRALPEHLSCEISDQLDRLALVEQQIGQLEAARDAVVKAAPSSAVRERKIQQLARLRSIGPEIATVLVGEAFYRDFKTRREVAAYGGLTGCPYNSGAVVREQGLTKSGNPRLRTIMVELAWLWLRHQPKSALSQWFQERLGKAEGRLKRVLIVALARKLLIALWRYLETGLVPTGATLKV